jgi:hypothetical protein
VPWQIRVLNRKVPFLNGFDLPNTIHHTGRKQQLLLELSGAGPCTSRMSHFPKCLNMD